MSLIVIYVVLSFYLDGLLSIYLPREIVNLSYFTTIYSLVALVIIYGYFHNHKKYLYILFILGFFFDIVYTNTMLLNVIIFFLLYLLLNKLDYYLSDNLFTINIKALIVVYAYHLITYIILLMMHYNSYNFKMFCNILLKNTLMTILYATISYIIIDKIFLKRSTKKIK